MNIQLITRGVEYTPIVFLNEDYTNKKYFPIQEHYDDSWRSRESTELKLNFNKIKETSLKEYVYCRDTNTYILGLGFIIRNRLLRGILTYKEHKDNIFLLIQKDVFNSADITRLKRQMKLNNINPKKTLIIRENLETEFITYFLSPTIEDYEKEKQEVLSKEFLNNLYVSNNE